MASLARAASAASSASLPGIDDFVADVEISHAGLGQRLRLEKNCTHAHRAGGDLPLGDLGALVRLGVWRRRIPCFARIGGHARDVALQRVEVDHQCRRGDGGDRIAHARSGGEAHGAPRRCRGGPARR